MRVISEGGLSRFRLYVGTWSEGGEVLWLLAGPHTEMFRFLLHLFFVSYNGQTLK